ncbi:MAG: DUF4955 domain-containing protein [Planctomycetota bacterium]|nr:DUF4955 domain-containing protein [Planctomycetota bacterium]
MTSKLWLQYLEAQRTGGVPVLANCSHAGYHGGLRPIGTALWKIYDVTEFGAVPSDGRSDKQAIRRAIAAAEAHGSGVIFFPRGRFRINEPGDDFNAPILIRSSRIVLRGSGSGESGTELFMARHMDAADPKKLWTTPCLIQFVGDSPDKLRVSVTGNAPRESHALAVQDSSEFQPGRWVRLSLRNNSPALVAAAVAPYKPNPAWASLIEDGVQIDEFLRIKRIEDGVLQFEQPLHAQVQAEHGWTLQRCRPLQEVGVEDLAFLGNWKEKFVHHKSAIHDGGWSLLALRRCANSWVRNCRFTDVNASIHVAASVGITVENVRIDGNRGHTAVHFSNTSHSIMKHVVDYAGTWHACGVAGRSSGNVILRCEYGEDTCYEAHASQPRWNLFDNVSGGWMYGRWGGAERNQPNHMRGLVFWNYENTGKGVKGDFHFLRAGSRWGHIIMPYVIGFHGNPQAWAEAEIEVLESNGAPVLPESLYEAQLALRKDALAKQPAPGGARRPRSPR